MKTKVGVVLSGGGVRGLAHIGFLKAMNEFGYQPEYISGCSSGAIVAGLYSAGCDYKQILEYFYTNAQIFKLSTVSAKKGGLFDSDKYISTLDLLITKDNFSDLDVNLIVNATDILQGHPVYFHKGNNVKKKIIASAAVPGIFTPINIENSPYVDGGTMDNFPVKPLLGLNLNIFGSFVSMHEKISKKEISNSLKLVSRAGLLAFNSGSIQKFNLCSHIVAPTSLKNYSLFDTKKMKEIFEIGYNETVEYLSKNEINKSI